MLTAPLFGYLGDRYSRKWILVFGLSMWSLSTLVGSLQRNFVAFMAFRALVGVGEASYSTIGKQILERIVHHLNLPSLFIVWRTPIFQLFGWIGRRKMVL